MSLGKEKLIPILAILVLIVGSSSSIYVYATQNKTTNIHNDSSNRIIIIGENEIQISYALENIEEITIETDDGEKTGIPIDELMVLSGIDCPSCHKYTIIAEDNYQKTVNWENMQEGILTKESRVYFPELAHAFWVRDVTEIEVN